MIKVKIEAKREKARWYGVVSQVWGQTLEAGICKKMKSPFESPEGTQACQHLHFSLSKINFRLPNYRNKRWLTHDIKTMKSEVICYSSSRKLIHHWCFSISTASSLTKGSWEHRFWIQTVCSWIPALPLNCYEQAIQASCASVISPVKWNHDRLVRSTHSAAILKMLGIL